LPSGKGMIKFKKKGIICPGFFDSNGQKEEYDGEASAMQRFGP
jgi:hypothetical protein